MTSDVTDAAPPVIRDVTNTSSMPQPVAGRMLAPGQTARDIAVDGDIQALADAGALVLAEKPTEKPASRRRAASDPDKEEQA